MQRELATETGMEEPSQARLANDAGGSDMSGGLGGSTRGSRASRPIVHSGMKGHPFS